MASRQRLHRFAAGVKCGAALQGTGTQCKKFANRRSRQGGKTLQTPKSFLALKRIPYQSKALLSNVKTAKKKKVSDQTEARSQDLLGINC